MKVQAPLHNFSLLYNHFFAPFPTPSLLPHQVCFTVIHEIAATRGQMFIILFGVINNH